MDKTQIYTRLKTNSLRIALLLMAFWPVSQWYVQRTFDRSDEPWGLLSLATAAFFVLRSSEIESFANPQEFFASALIGAYALSFPVLPSLVQGILMVIAFWCCFANRINYDQRWGVLGLLLLSLPLVPSINFYAGYPLRLLVAQLSQLMLAFVGIASTREGTLLLIGNTPMSIDAPCSGISMLWVGLYAAMSLACHFRLGLKFTALLMGAIVALLLLANSARAAALILFDFICKIPSLGMQLNSYEPAVHVWVGLVAFAATIAIATFTAMRISQRITQSHRDSQSDEPGARTSSPGTRMPVYPSVLLYSVCLCAALVPFSASGTCGAQQKSEQPNWPTELLGRQITAVASLDEENAFAADFPGHMRRFTDGTKSYFVRVVNKETRQLHPSSDCFKGIGYSIEPRPLLVSPDGTRWSSFVARKGNSSLQIMEQLHDNHGHTWTDVSEWYWYALMHESDGPWWDITVACPLESPPSIR